MTKRNFQKMEYDAEHRQENNNGLRTEKIMLEITHCCMYPGGWLTAEERSSIQHAANLAKANWSYSVAQELENILARSTPPEVVMQTVFTRAISGDSLVKLDQVKEALAAAGVPWKEAGK